MGARILLIDDHRDAAEMLGEMLTLLGFEVEVCHGGGDGLEAARRTPPDVVICDLGLPEVDGFTVARELSEDPRTRHARLIALSGRSQPEEQRRSLEAGFSRHLVKPVTPDTVKQHLDEVLGEAAPGGDAGHA